MQTLMIERMEPGNPDSLYRAEIGGRGTRGPDVSGGNRADDSSGRGEGAK